MDIVVNPPHHDWEKPFTVRHIQEVTESEANRSPTDVKNDLEQAFGLKIKFKSKPYGQIEQIKFVVKNKIAMSILDDTSDPRKYVHVETGLKYRKVSRQCDASSHHSPRISALLQYLNAPKRFFSKMPELLVKLKEEVIVSRNLGLIKPESATGQLAAITFACQYPQPMYKEVWRTARIYTHGNSILGLKKEFREELFRKLGWISLDLKAAQLAIVAKLWDIPMVSNILSSEPGIWQYLAENMGWEDKGLFKSSVYAIIFGSSTTRKTKNGLPTIWAENGKSLIELGQFLAIPAIHELVIMRDQRRRAIDSQGYVMDAFNKKRKLNMRKGVNAASLLANEVQSYEMAIMLDVADAVRTKRIDIAAWIHDGIAIYGSTDKRKVERAINRAEEAVSVWNRKGFITSLEVKR